MSEWEPATDAEVAMRDALRTDDQESYFRILAGVDLLLPVSADALAGLAPLGWGTWSTGGRTHVLAFTSQEALHACLSDYTGSSRRVPYTELANTWPNLEWWLAVNPGLPIEGYLPAWFVAQLARGDLRLPTRGPGRDVHGTSKIQELGAAALAASRAGDGPGGPTYDAPAAAAAGYPVQPAGSPGLPPPGGSAGATGVPQPGPGQPARPAMTPAGLPQRGAPQPGAQPVPAVAAQSGPGGMPAPGQASLGSDAGSARSGAGGAFGGSQAGPGGASGSAAFGPGGVSGSAPFGPSATPGASQFGPGAAAQGPSGQPGDLPVRSPGAGVPARSATPSGLPMRTATASPAQPPAAGDMTRAEQVPAAYPASGSGRDLPGSPAAPAASSGLPTRSLSGSAMATPGWHSDSLPFGPENDPRGPLQDLNAPLPVRTPMANTPPVPEHVRPYDPAEALVDPGWAALGGRPSSAGSGGAPGMPAAAGADAAGGANTGTTPPTSPTLARGGSDLPRRQPGQTAGPSQTTSFSGFANARTNPAPAAAPRFPQGPASPQAVAAQPAPASGAPAPGTASSSGGPGSPLPRRQVTPPSERPPSMAAAAQALTGGRTPAPDPGLPQRDVPPAADRFGPSGPAPSLPRSDGAAGGDRPAPSSRPGLLPPVIPGAPGADRGAGGAMGSGAMGHAGGGAATGAPAPGYGPGTTAPGYGAAAAAFSAATSGLGPAASGSPTAPAYGSPVSGAAAPGHPVSGAAAPAHPVSGAAAPGHPVSGAAAPGHPVSGAAAPGHPVSGAAAPGHPVSGAAAPGHPVSGAATPGHPVSGAAGFPVSGPANPAGTAPAAPGSPSSAYPPPGAPSSAYPVPGDPAPGSPTFGAPTSGGPTAHTAGSSAAYGATTPGAASGYGTAGAGYGPAGAYAPTAPGYSVPAVPAPGPAFGMPPQGSPASAYANQALATQIIQLPAGSVPASAASASGSSGLGVAGSATGGGSGPGQRGRAHEEFVPANDTERELREAADAGNTDIFLSTLLLANVLVPVAHHSRPGSAPGESGFAFQPEEVGGEKFLIVFTSKDRLSEHFGEPTRTVGVRFYELIRNWPDPDWSFAVNPGTPVGAKYPGAQIIALANWATEAGLGADPIDGPSAEETAEPVPAPEPASDETQHATVMQKTIAAEQVDYYLERGYDRVAGFVHRASEVEHLRTPAELFSALGLYYDSSPFQPDAKEAFVLRWPAFRPSLYRIPYGGQNEQALRAMDGWVIERPPFRGNGFAPGEGRDVIAEFKVDSVRLPHGAQLWRIDADGNERMLAIFDADGPLWRRVGEQ